MAQLTGQVGAQDIPAGVQIILDADNKLALPTGDPAKDHGRGAGTTMEALPAGARVVMDVNDLDGGWRIAR